MKVLIYLNFIGIGVILPIMEITENQERYPVVVFSVLTTVVVSYLFFGELTYVTWGSDLGTIVTENIPINTPFNEYFKAVIIFVFCINLIFSYPLMLFPANVALENYIFKGWDKTKKR